MVQLQIKKENVYVPDLAKLIKKRKMTEWETLFTFEFVEGRMKDLFTYKPGQFVQLSMFGIGEAPFSISSSPTKRGYLELGIRKTGDVTNKIHELEVGDVVGIRGPYGNGFPTESLKGRDILFVAGGIGLVPLRSLINYVIDNRDDFGEVTIFYGTRSPDLLLFKDELAAWEALDDIDLHVTVDAGDDDWKGNVGVVTTLFKKKKFKTENLSAVVCGPPIVYKFVVKELLDIGVGKDQILLSLERKMKCGVGKCAHCQIGHKLTCIDGPVFTLFQVEQMQEAI
ncbi:MAG: Sulfhydrogenase 2 subunit gamma [Candidatus Thorarchaeota archaeon]|nr:MAG: Sulfhydrogenase 2 subunit gamma [Candidatus Thorarchaeota archaeon]